jgi:hypothetical protein
MYIKKGIGHILRGHGQHTDIQILDHRKSQEKQTASTWSQPQKKTNDPHDI